MKKFVFASLLASLASPLAYAAEQPKAPPAEQELTAQDVAVRKMEMRKKVVEQISQDVPVAKSAK